MLASFDLLNFDSIHHAAEANLTSYTITLIVFFNLYDPSVSELRWMQVRMGERISFIRG